jgi:histidyl-tRNA synthetase
MSAMLMAGINPERLRREAILDQRRKIADLLRMAGVETKFSVTELKRRTVREAIHAAERSGCSILIVGGRQALDPRGGRAIKAASIEVVDAQTLSA